MLAALARHSKHDLVLSDVTLDEYLSHRRLEHERRVKDAEKAVEELLRSPWWPGRDRARACWATGPRARPCRARRSTPHGSRSARSRSSRRARRPQWTAVEFDPDSPRASARHSAGRC